MSIPQVEGFESAASGSVLAKPPFWHSFAFLPLALIGIAATAVPLARRGRGAQAALSPSQRRRMLLAASTLVYSVSIALFFVTDRYRVPILPLLMLLAVDALVVIGSAIAAPRRRLLPLLLVAVAVVFFVTDPARLGVDQRRLRRDLHVHTALRYAQAQHFDAAVTEYRAALSLDPQDADTRDGWARMLGRAGQDSAALNAFQSLLHDHPDDARAWYNLGNLYRRLRRIEPARAAYERSLALEPNRETAWNHLGEVYRAMGDTARAARCYQRALAVVPAHEPALSNLAALRAQQGHAAEAEAGWRAALAANPRHLPSLVNLAILLTESGRTAEALPLWQRALSVDPDNELARRVLEQLDPQAARSLPKRGPAPSRKPGDED
jgi:tetratricopeptide (TPR) repeat protein